MTPPTVVAVLRTGKDFLPEHVHALFTGVEKYWRPVDQPPRLVVLTDVPVEQYGLLGHLGVRKIPLRYDWPGWWSKMELFRPELGAAFGDILYFDLDTVVVGELGDIAEVRYLTLLEDFYQSWRLGSGMMYLPQEVRGEVWEEWIKDPAAIMASFRGDQEYLTPRWEPVAERWQHLLPGQVVSYKKDVRPKGQVPGDARVVCFHGRPRPWHLKEGLPK